MYILSSIGLYLSGLTASPKGSGKVSESRSMNRRGIRDDPGTYDWRDKGVIGAIRNQQRVSVNSLR